MQHECRLVWPPDPKAAFEAKKMPTWDLPPLYPQLCSPCVPAGSCNKGGPWDPLTHTSAIAPFLEDAEREAKVSRQRRGSACCAAARSCRSAMLKAYGIGIHALHKHRARNGAVDAIWLRA